MSLLWGLGVGVILTQPPTPCSLSLCCCFLFSCPNPCLPWLSNPTSQGTQLPAFRCGVAFLLFPWLHLLLPLPVLLFPSAPALLVLETQFSFTFLARPHGSTPPPLSKPLLQDSAFSGSPHPSSACFCAVWTNPLPSQKPRAELCLCILD